MKKLSFILLLLSLTLTACFPRRTPAPLGADAPADNVPNIIGEYGLNAEDATKERYGGSLFITAGSKPNEYNLQWLVSGDIQEGVGTLEGNQLTFTWKSVEGTDQYLTGYGTYTVTVNGELYGVRYVDGVDAPGTESAYPNPK
jgi:hypothetical protein